MGSLLILSGYLKRFFQFVVIPVAALLYYFRSLHPEMQLLHILYIVCVSSLVGYWTNYCAIKMLFRPREKRFGFQGVIPAHQGEIAGALGKVIRERFFNPNDIISYCEEKELIKRFFAQAKDTIDRKLEDQAFKKKMIEWIDRTFTNYSPKIHSALQDLSESFLNRYLNKSFDPQHVVKSLTEFLETNIKNGNIDLEKITDAVLIFIHDTIPPLSQYLNKIIEQEIEQSSFAEKIVLKVGRYFFQLNPTTIKYKLRKMVRDPDFRQKVYHAIHTMASDCGHYLEREEVANEIKRYATICQATIITTTKERLLPDLLNKIKGFLNKKESWDTIEHYCDALITFTAKELELFIASKECSRLLNQIIPELLERFDIESLITERAQKFETSELEDVIMNVTGKHLSHIEVLGGIIGGFAGFALLI
jgi:uncharacterized membrane protein YheB (UPF0754 family)